MPEEGKKILRDKLVSRYQWVNGHLDGKDWLMGDQFSVADGYFFAVTRWAKPMNIDLSGAPNVAAHHERMAARPAVREALQFEGLLEK
jgi:glutathione S-transferase